MSPPRSQKSPHQRRQNVLSEVYEGVTFTRRPSSGRPGTPHSYFEASYNVHFATTTHHDPDNSRAEQPQPHQVVHTHVNGLAIVTAGESFCTAAASAADSASTTSPSPAIQAIDVVAQVADIAHQSAGKKRKRQSQMLQRGKQHTRRKGSESNGTPKDSAVYPTDVLVTLLVKDSVRKESSCTGEEDKDTTATQRSGDTNSASNCSSIPLRCCVYGSILEINSQLVQNPQIVHDNPSLDGYLAIVLPSGPFPPPSNIQLPNKDDLPETRAKSTMLLKKAESRK